MGVGELGKLDFRSISCVDLDWKVNSLSILEPVWIVFDSIRLIYEILKKEL